MAKFWNTVWDWEYYCGCVLEIQFATVACMIGAGLFLCLHLFPQRTSAPDVAGVARCAPALGPLDWLVLPPALLFLGQLLMCSPHPLHAFTQMSPSQ